MKISMRLSSVLKVAAVATGMFMLTPHSSAVEYGTEGMIRVKLVSDMGEKAECPRGVDPEKFDDTPKFTICTVTKFVGSGSYDGTWIDLNNNGKYDKGEEIFASANHVTKKMVPGVREMSMYVKPEIRMLEVLSSALTSIDATGCPNLTTLGLEKNHLSFIDISNCPNLRFLRLAMNKLTEIKGAIGHEYSSMEVVEISRNQLGAEAIYRLAAAIGDRSKTVGGETLTPGKIYISDLCELEKNQVSKGALALLKKKNWEVILHERYDGVEVQTPNGPTIDVGEDYTEGEEQYENWVATKVIEDPADLNSEQLANDMLKVYPSVTASNFNVEVPAGLLGSDLLMYNMNGNLVYTERLNGRTSIDAARLPDGVYLIKVNNQIVRVQVAH
ncbi:hypothetical protein PORCRE_329 [Porphyromonas crevioricanis JCM 15906]|uniref:Secretion system C-terminal sorting domain-containing protein n=1 Tax=Porphyromonas crevioricanis JCM 15906 TaxID=1305617 RepID=T1DR17_9PORP|nr:T9SS type A sorting domain-containing protein [Porphyromonas crevioricanis]GAD04639.1 hypothetical protein PORCRE_329 [Porphyromonas crevioricanis JCM 15906]